MNQDDLCILNVWVTYRSHPAWKVIIDKTARSLIRLQRGWECIAFKNIASPSWDKSCLNLTCTQAQPSSPSHSRALLLSAGAKQTILSAKQGCLNREEGEPLQQNASWVAHQADFCDCRMQRQRLLELVDFYLTLSWVSHFTSNLLLLVVPGTISWVVCMQCCKTAVLSHPIHCTLHCDQPDEFFICVDACPMSLWVTIHRELPAPTTRSISSKQMGPISCYKRRIS